MDLPVSMPHFRSRIVLIAALVVLFGALQPGAEAATSQPNDYFFAGRVQWALTGAPSSINAPAAWCRSTGSGIVIADIDSGADFSHEDLAGKLLPGAAFVNPLRDDSGQMTGSGTAAVSDDNGHGTVMAGLLVARTNNRVGIASVAPDARSLVVKVVNSSGRGNGADVAAGMRWAVDHGANVLNISIGTSQFVFPSETTGTSPIADAAEYASEHGVAVAFAAGNDSSGFNPYQLLQDKPNVLVVGALTRDGTVPSYSNGNASIYAPGGEGYAGTDPNGQVQHDVVSTYYGNAYATAAGTSVATPLVAGVFALLMARGYSADAAKQQILSSARPGDTPALDATGALGATPGTRCGVRVAASPVRPRTQLRVAPSAPPAPRRAVSAPKPTAANRVSSARIELSLPSPTPAPLAIARPQTGSASGRPLLFAISGIMLAVALLAARRFR